MDGILQDVSRKVSHVVRILSLGVFRLLLIVAMFMTGGSICLLYAAAIGMVFMGGYSGIFLVLLFGSFLLSAASYLVGKNSKMVVILLLMTVSNVLILTALWSMADEVIMRLYISFFGLMILSLFIAYFSQLGVSETRVEG